ncbi:MAG: hypothetical protein WD651_10640 [Acidimicrobiia bacterium]
MTNTPMNFDAVTFGHRVRHFRKRKGLTLDQLGGLVDRPAPFYPWSRTAKKNLA